MARAGARDEAAGRGQDHHLARSPRTFPEAGTYVFEVWAKGPSGSQLVDRQGGKTFDLSPAWTRYSYQFDMPTEGRRRFVLEARNLQGQSVWLDDLVVYRKDGRGDLEPVSLATGRPSTVTYADGICYINGKPTFMLGFVRSDPDVVKGTPFNLSVPLELPQSPMAYLDKCAKVRSMVLGQPHSRAPRSRPKSAVLFARKYRNHPALFSYYVCDEPNHSSPSAASEPPVLARATQLLHQADPRHLTQTGVIPWCSSGVYRYRDTVDILSADQYSVRGTRDNAELWLVYRANEALRRSATDGQVNIFIPLAPRNITHEENWAQAYMCVAAGAGGILWFPFEHALRQLGGFPGTRQGTAFH